MSNILPGRTALDSEHRRSASPFMVGTLVLVLLGALLVLFVLHAIFGYWLEGVGSKEVAIQMHAGQPIRVVGPGNYSDLTPFASLQRIDASELSFTVSDPEVLTKDSQRIGVTAQGTVRRPGLDHSDVLLGNWSRFSTFYTDNTALTGRPPGTSSKDDPGAVGLMQNLGNQAIKVCVGDLNFADAVIGSARDKLRECIDTEFNTLASGYGLTVNNIVVPNVILSKAVQDSLDAITKARFDQQVADQQALTAKAQADQQLAVAAGAIRVEQGKVQEQARQDAVTADLNQKTLAAQRAVIEQQKANDLFAAQQDVEIQRQQAQAAAQKALASQADMAAVARIYQDNPAYANQKPVEAQASAWKETDKVIVPAGTNPTVVLGNGTQQQTVVQSPAR
jgi:SPFH domain / Band 7 family